MTYVFAALGRMGVAIATSKPAAASAAVAIGIAVEKAVVGAANTIKGVL